MTKVGRYVKVVHNKEFDVVGGYIGGFEDIPTKQDKFKPIQDAEIIAKKNDGSEEKLADVYVMNHKVKQSIKDFEAKFLNIIKGVKTGEHPYKKDIPLEVIINVKMSAKRYNNVDVDNIAKCVLDVMKGELFEDDSQLQSLFIYKEVPSAIPLEPHLQEYTGSKEIPEGMAGIIFGIRRLDTRESLMAHHEFYHFEDISEEEYLKSKEVKS